MTLPAAFLTLLVSAVHGLPPRLPAPDASVLCQPTPHENPIPSVVGPMTGTGPAWFVDGDMRWDRAEHPVKTLWVFSRTTARVRITGHRIDGEGTARFRRGQDEPSEDLVIADPSAESAIPGGASRDVMQAYAFIPSHVFYPSPGCWQFTIEIGGEEVRLVRLFEPAR